MIEAVAFLVVWWLWDDWEEGVWNPDAKASKEFEKRKYVLQAGNLDEWKKSAEKIQKEFTEE